MSKFRFSASVTISISTVVEADTEEEAWKIAREREMQSFCYYCTSRDEEVWTTSGELDGEAQDIRLGEADL